MCRETFATHVQDSFRFKMSGICQRARLHNSAFCSRISQLLCLSSSRDSIRPYRTFAMSHLLPSSAITSDTVVSRSDTPASRKLLDDNRSDKAFGLHNEIVTLYNYISNRVAQIAADYERKPIDIHLRLGTFGSDMARKCEGPNAFNGFVMQQLEEKNGGKSFFRDISDVLYLPSVIRAANAERQDAYKRALLEAEDPSTVPRPYKEPLAKATWVAKERMHIYENLKPEELEELKGRVLAKRKEAKSVPAGPNRILENAAREMNAISRQVIDLVSTHSRSNSWERGTPTTSIHSIFGAINLPFSGESSPTRSPFRVARLCIY